MNDLPLAQRFADAMGQLLGPDFPNDIGLAVSGGGDSMAMLYLAHNWTREYGIRLWVVTVDHGLRAESADEASMVAEECAILGWPHATLRWRWDGVGNVQDAARRARLSLIDSWRGNLRHVLFAHTQDDQAETVLMRLLRGSGVDGLAGMRSTRQVFPNAVSPPKLDAAAVSGISPPSDAPEPGFSVLRPCLEMEREELRHYARTLKGRWVDDPSNENEAYERVRIRNLLRVLRKDGFTSIGLSETARRLARARDSLQARLAWAVREHCRNAPPGQVRVDRDGFAALDTETQLRLLTSALRYVTSSEYRPRAASSEALLDRALSGAGGTLHGAELVVERTELRIHREPAAVRDCTSSPGILWDGQWLIEGEGQVLPRSAEIRALGDVGWRQIPDRTGANIAYRASLALPAIWDGATLFACPALGFGPKILARRYVLGRPDTGFEAFCLSH